MGWSRRQLRRLLAFIISCRVLSALVFRLSPLAVCQLFGPTLRRLVQSQLVTGALRTLLGKKMLHQLCFDGPPLSAMSDPFFKMRGGGLLTQSGSMKEFMAVVAPQELWEWWLDECGFRSESPIRQKIKCSFGTPHFEQQLQAVFDYLTIPGYADQQLPARLEQQRSAVMSIEDLLRFHHAVRGNIRVMLHRQQSTPLLNPSEQETNWLQAHFDRLLAPLDCPTFCAWAKVVLVRRLAKTLAETLKQHATFDERVEEIRKGLCVNVVVDICVTFTGRDEDALLHLHTIAPRSDKVYATAVEEESDGWSRASARSEPGGLQVVRQG